MRFKNHVFVIRVVFGHHWHKLNWTLLHNFVAYSIPSMADEMLGIYQFLWFWANVELLHLENDYLIINAFQSLCFLSAFSICWRAWVKKFKDAMSGRPSQLPEIVKHDLKFSIDKNFHFFQMMLLFVRGYFTRTQYSSCVPYCPMNDGIFNCSFLLLSNAVTSWRSDR